MSTIIDLINTWQEAREAHICAYNYEMHCNNAMRESEREYERAFQARDGAGMERAHMARTEAKRMHALAQTAEVTAENNMHAAHAACRTEIGRRGWSKWFHMQDNHLHMNHKGFIDSVRNGETPADADEIVSTGVTCGTIRVKSTYTGTTESGCYFGSGMCSSHVYHSLGVRAIGDTIVDDNGFSRCESRMFVGTGWLLAVENNYPGTDIRDLVWIKTRICKSADCPCYAHAYEWEACEGYLDGSSGCACTTMPGSR